MGIDNSSIRTGSGDDTIVINANASANGWNWWGGNADAVAVDNSSINMAAVMTPSSLTSASTGELVG